MHTAKAFWENWGQSKARVMLLLALCGIKERTGFA
jgi:hypothetical protein